MRQVVRGLVVLGALLGPAVAARGQLGDVIIDPRLGPSPTFGPGGFLSNGFGYGMPNGGYAPGLYLPGYDFGNGPSPYYSPIFSAMATMPSPYAPYQGPGGERAGWALRPSLPFTGQRNYHLFHRRER